MNNFLSRWIGCLLSILFTCEFALGQNFHVIALNTIEARPLAMGGAFISIEDGLPAVQYNPAALGLFKNQRDNHFAFHFNPVSSAIGFSEYNVVKQSIKDEWKRSLAFAGLILRGISYSNNLIDISVLLGEESIEAIEKVNKERFFDVETLLANHANTIALKFQLDEQIAFGFTSSVYIANETENDTERKELSFSTSYGVLVKPNSKINIGITYINFFKNEVTHRRRLSRFDDETVSVGISYYPNPKTIFSGDLRNISAPEEDNRLVEPHIGIERQLTNHISAQFGYFLKRDIFLDQNDKKQQESSNVLSMGISVINANQWKGFDDRLKQFDPMINYGFLYEQDNQRHIFWHFFSLQFRF